MPIGVGAFFCPKELSPVVVLILVVIALLLAIASLVPFANNWPLLSVAVILLAVAMLAGSTVLVR